MVQLDRNRRGFGVPGEQFYIRSLNLTLLPARNHSYCRMQR
jgi:hypothetical protein